MRFANEASAIAFRVLNKCSRELEPDGPWRWRCAVKKGALPLIAASLDEDFLHLECFPKEIRESACTVENAVLGNRTLAGGVKLAMGGANNALRLVTDIVVLEERQLFDRLQWAFEGFREGHLLLKSPASRRERECASANVSEVGLGEMLREASWPSTERGLNNFTAELDANSAPPARIQMSNTGVMLSVDLVRADSMATTTRKALAVFLLMATAALRLVRAYAEQVDGEFVFGMQVNLPCVPAIEEVDHALAALSVAYRVCARETNVLLNEATARCYLAARNYSTTNEQQSEQEN